MNHLLRKIQVQIRSNSTTNYKLDCPLKGLVHFKKTKQKKTFSDNLLTPHVIQDVHVFLSLVKKKKIRFLMKTFLDFLHIMDFNGN